MALIHTMEEQGNKLFRYRGQLPVLLFILAIPFIYLTNYDIMPTKIYWYVGTGAAVFTSLIGTWIRAVAIATTPKNTSGRNTKEQIADSLNTTGIYSTVRHPLYLGNYFMWLGIVMFTFNFYYIIIMTLMYWLYYERIMFAEERFLERKFGEDYVAWSKKVPAFWPSGKNKVKNVVPFSVKSILRREYSGWLATVVGFIFVDVVRDFFHFHDMKFYLNMKHVYVLGGAIVITLILRSLKHYTKVLHEDDRS